jgi:hypothetical protein
MFRSILLTATITAFGWTACASHVPLAQARSDDLGPTTLAIAHLDYIDTSGEAKDQAAAHREFLDAFRHALQSDLSSSGKYRIVPIGCGARPCTSGASTAELQEAAEAAGARLVVTGGIHKMSTLVQWAKIQIADADQGRIVFDRLLTFRGDSAAAWQRAEAFLARDILAASPGFDASASAPRANLAVFDFELEDFSGGATLIPKSASDIEQLTRATEAARGLITQSANYSLVDVNGAGAPSVKTHELHNCDGCDARIARALGADQSLVGIVTRISRTDYTVTFKLRDARTGALIAVEQTDLRMGANYSWGRGATWLIKNRLLEKEHQR